MILLLDNFDSFTYNLVDYFNQLGVQCKVLRNNIDLTEIRSEDYKGLVISPGPEIPGKAGKLMEVLAYYHDKIPVLGICLGHQAIGEFFGAKIVHAEKPMHGKISRIRLEDDILFDGLPEVLNVVRYNSLIIDHNTKYFKTIAKSSNEEIMAIRHNTLPVWGVQFHPEAALTENGLEMLKNWVSYNNIAV